MPLVRSRNCRSRGVKIELLVSTRNGVPRSRRRDMNASAPGTICPSWTSTPSMSVIQHSIGLGSPTTGQPRGTGPARPAFEWVTHCGWEVVRVEMVLTLVVLGVVGVGVVGLTRQSAATKPGEVDEEKPEARRWVERLGGQVLNLVG